MSALEVYTIQMSQWRQAKALDVELLDITVKSGDKRLAPTWGALLSYKDGSISEEDYTDRYVRLMNNSYKTHPALWESLLSKRKVALACYCRAGGFCHRYILTKLIESLAKQHDVAMTYMGEITASGVYSYSLSNKGKPLRDELVLKE